jgi:hypothetical protein
MTIIDYAPIGKNPCTRLDEACSKPLGADREKFLPALLLERGGRQARER